MKGDALRVVNVGKPEELFLANPAATGAGVEMGMEAEDVRVRRAMQRTTVFVLTQKCSSHPTLHIPLLGPSQSIRCTLVY